MLAIATIILVGGIVWIAVHPSSDPPQEQGPGPQGDTASLPKECGRFSSMAADDQQLIASGILDRVGNNSGVERDSAAFAKQLRDACSRNPSFALAEMAAMIITLANAKHLENYDDPLPMP